LQLGYLVLFQLFVKVLRSGGSDLNEMNFSVIEPSCHLLLPVQPLKTRGNLVKSLAQGHKQAYLPTCSPHLIDLFFNAERQALIYLSRYLDQETAKVPFRSSSQAATCYYQSNHSMVEAIPVNAWPRDTTSELAGLSPHSRF